jgi:hypothetical protein
VPAWKRWSPFLLRPEGLYGTRPAEGGNKAAKLKAIRVRDSRARAIIPNVNMIDKLWDIWLRLSSDEKKLFDVGGVEKPRCSTP